MGLQHLLALLPLVVTIAQAQLDGVTTTDNITTTSVTTADAATSETETVSAPVYTPEECDNWISTMTASDIDSSNGLSSSEYFGFLSGIEDPPYIAEYFQGYESFNVLPFSFRVVHKILACHCQKLGMGEECCEGSNAEVQLLGLEESATPSTDVEEEYKDLFCQQIAFVLSQSIASPAPTAAPSLSPSKSPMAGPTQSPTRAPSSNPTISPVAGASDLPSVSLGSIIGEPTSSNPTITPVAGATDSPSVSFRPTIGEKEVDGSRGIDNSVEEKEDSGLGTGAIIGIILALVAALLLIMALVAHRRNNAEKDSSELEEVQVPEADLEAPPPAMEEKEPQPEPEQAHEPDDDDESSEASEWSESDDDEDTMGELHDDNDDNENKASAGSALAAMGAASTVAANLMSPTPSPKGLEHIGDVEVPNSMGELHDDKASTVTASLS